MSLEEVQQNYADATGLIIDRTVTPPKVLGQAFLISRNRAVTCASVVYNYAEAPWALALQFVHPNVTLGVKGMVLHPEFDKKQARNWYLNQTGMPGEQLVMNNDIATVTLEMQLLDMPLEKMGELNRALSLPFSSAGVESSGNIRGEEFLQILHGIVTNRKEGLLTLFDSRNIPISRLQIGPTGIQKVYYRGLLGELAFFELVYRKPAAGYSFQTESEFNWGNVRDITAPTEALVQEAMRRATEIPAQYAHLGGEDARYQQRIENYDASNASESIQWFAERLWACVDGYLVLDKMSERAGADTYSVLQAVREMVNKAQISQINRPPFHQNGVLGTPLISHTDFEVNAWDPLQAFYIDPVSGRPMWMAGNFFGVANALQPKNMLHTIQVPGAVPGGMILKDYKLIGIHSGPFTPKPGQALPPFQGKIFQYMWMGALLDISTSKKVGVMPGADPSQTGSQVAISGLRNQSFDEKPPADQEKLLKLICPNCHATNSQPGACFNCGTTIEAPEAEPEAEGGTQVSKVLKQLEEKTKLPQKQIIMIGSGLVALILVAIIGMLSGSGSPPPTTTTAPTPNPENQHASSEKAMKTAVEFAGFKATAIPGYWYEDTSDITKPNVSFGMNSEQSNQRILFVIMDSLAPVDNLQSFVGFPPYCEVYRANVLDLKDIRVEENYQILGDGSLHWFVGRYTKQKAPVGDVSPIENILVGAYPATVKGKSILVIGRSLTPDKPYDYKSTLWLCDQMATDYTASGNAKRDKNMVVDPNAPTTGKNKSEDRPIATDTELDSFTKQVETEIQSHLRIPDDVADEIKKRKKGVKAEINVGISGADGSINKLEITQQSDFEGLTDSLSKAVSASAPFKDPPRTKNGSIKIIVTLNKDQIKVQRP